MPSYKPFFLSFYILLFCAVKVNAQTVYIAETGKKYHTKNCPALQKSNKEIDLKVAQKKGYKPCHNCGAEKIKPKEERKEDIRIDKKKEQK